MDEVFCLLEHAIKQQYTGAEIKFSRATRRDQLLGDAQNSRIITFHGFGTINSLSYKGQEHNGESKQLELHHPALPSLHLTQVSKCKLKGEINHLDLISIIQVAPDFNAAINSTGPEFAYINGKSWLRTFYLGEVLEQFTEKGIIWLVKHDSKYVLIISLLLNL